MTLNKVIVQIAEYPRVKGKSKSIIINGEDYIMVHARIEHLFKQLAQHDKVTITHTK